METFSFHVVLDRDDICNYREEQAALLRDILAGKRIVLIGRRNTGKTSLVRSVLSPEFRKQRKNSLVVYVDFMGVKDMESIVRRMRVGFEQGFRESFPKTALLQRMASLLKGIRPTLSIDPISGETALSISSVHEQELTLEEILKQLSAIHKESSCLIIFDEFQDIALVKEAEARLRGALQMLPKDLPVIILGSKKHLLAKIFTRPGAPFASWGLPLELPDISAEDYHPYIAKRFRQKKLQISLSAVKYLLELVHYNPESTNIVCDTILSHWENKEIDEAIIGQAMVLTVDRMQSGFREFLSHMTTSQQKLLFQIAKREPVKQVSSATFLSGLGLSQAGVSVMIKRFEDDAVIYRTDHGYILADALLSVFLRRQ